MKTSKIYAKKAFTVLMCIAVIICAFTFSSSAKSDVIDYTITNPYAAVDWQTWGLYKANLHCHTIVSDGDDDFNKMIEMYYALGYDALAITDHGVTDYSWTDVHTVPGIALISKFDQKNFDLTPTGLTDERYTEITTAGADGHAMIRVPYGIENNPTSFNNAHVNSWFAPYGDGVLGGTSDYERPLKGVKEAGGLCVINHPGEYTSAKKESNPDLAYNEDYSYYINKFTSLLLKYDNCIGIDINSKTDGRTKNDRKLWDILLANCIPNGRSVFAIGSSDAHRESAVDSGWTVHCMPENTVDNLRESMETGAFFAGSRYIKNTKELAEISSALGETIGTDEWTVSNTLGIPNPTVTAITTSNETDSITINAADARLIRFIADGKQIAVTTTEDCKNGNISATLNLNDYSSEIGSYVRAEIFGEGGILYTQAFTLDYDGAPEAKEFRFFDFGKLVSWFRDGLLLVLGLFPLFALFWKVITGKWSQLF